MATASDTSSPSAFKVWWNRTSRPRAAYLFLVPAFVVMGVITFYPMFYQVWMSFTDYGIANLRFDAPLPNWVGLKNYLDIFSGALAAKLANFNFLRLLGFNLIWTFTNVPIHVVMGVLIAVLLNVKGMRFKGFWRAIYILPIVMPTLVVATVWRNMFDQNYGAVNQSLAAVGQWVGIAPEVFHLRWFEQIQPPIPWFFPGLALPLSYYALLIANIWLGWPFMTIVATGALQSIPNDLYEAAKIDGASSVEEFFNITVPLIRPAMVPAAMYGIIQTFNLFNLIFLMSQGGPLRQTEIMVTTAYDLVRTQRLYGMAAAFCVIIFFILLGLTMLTNQVTKATERYDA